MKLKVFFSEKLSDDKENYTAESQKTQKHFFLSQKTLVSLEISTSKVFTDDQVLKTASRAL